MRRDNKLIVFGNSIWELFCFKSENKKTQSMIVTFLSTSSLSFSCLLCLCAKIDCLFEANELLFELVNLLAWLGTFNENLITYLYIFHLLSTENWCQNVMTFQASATYMWHSKAHNSTMKVLWDTCMYASATIPDFQYHFGPANL